LDLSPIRELSTQIATLTSETKGHLEKVEENTPGTSNMNANVEKTTVRKVYLRALPLLFVAYFICYLDRINVGFAALTMNKDLVSMAA
jgi:hypothetical protein